MGLEVPVARRAERPERIAVPAGDVAAGVEPVAQTALPLASLEVRAHARASQRPRSRRVHLLGSGIINSNIMFITTTCYIIVVIVVIIDIILSMNIITH